MPLLRKKFCINLIVIFRVLNSTLGLEANYTFRSSDKITAFSAVYTGSYTGVQTSFQFLLERFEDILEGYVYLKALFDSLLFFEAPQHSVYSLLYFIILGLQQVKFRPSSLEFRLG